jgi:hypothetical protein
MADWHCFKDKVKMAERDVLLRYMQLTQSVPGLKCPVCGVEYLTEHVVMTTVAAAEEALEQK